VYHQRIHGSHLITKIMSKIITFLSFLFLFTACNNCYDYKRHVETLDYKFVITEKSKDNRYVEFRGSDKNKNKIIFNEGEVWGIYDYVEIGDTLLKKKGEADLVLIKKDTTIVFPFMCGGRYYQ
jgi:hypothetical protein